MPKFEALAVIQARTCGRPICLSPPDCLQSDGGIESIPLCSHYRIVGTNEFSEHSSLFTDEFVDVGRELRTFGVYDFLGDASLNSGGDKVYTVDSISSMWVRGRF